MFFLLNTLKLRAFTKNIAFPLLFFFFFCVCVSNSYKRVEIEVKYLKEYSNVVQTEHIKI